MDVTIREFERSNLFLRHMSLRARGNSAMGRCIAVALFVAAFATAADPPIPPLTVCEVMADFPTQHGKYVAGLGRYSFRRDSRWIADASCAPATNRPTRLVLTAD